LGDDHGAPDRVLLIGMMGAGKSTVGHLVAAQLGWPYLDSDDEILRRTGRTVPEIWHDDGEPAFRAEEAAVLADATSSAGPVVVGVAGGAVLDPRNRARIAGAGLVVWLRVRVATLIARVGDGAGRPLLDGDPAGAMIRLEAARRPIYQSLADVAIDVDDLTPADVAARIVADVRGGEFHRAGRPDASPAPASTGSVPASSSRD
jgi:shikimate kinase